MCTRTCVGRSRRTESGKTMISSLRDTLSALKGCGRRLRFCVHSLMIKVPILVYKPDQLVSCDPFQNAESVVCSAPPSRALISKSPVSILLNTPASIMSKSND